tara:strand:+ start:746 stop:1012 length:267 start_codon:yes stop_codon:yes gene_type:complete
MYRYPDSPSIVLEVTRYERLNPPVTIGRETIPTSGIEFLDAMDKTSNALLIQVIVGTTTILDRKLVYDLMNQTNIGKYQLVKSTFVQT